MFLRVIYVALLCFGAMSCVPLNDNGHTMEDTAWLTDTVESFMADTGLSGAALGILQDDELVYAGGWGHVRGGNAGADSLLPILGLSKLVTAVGILQLVEHGHLELTDTVFGKRGILYYMKPEAPNQMDSHLHHITVQHLLQHTAGWDETSGPVFDPMLNSMFIKRGYRVVDIAKEMNVFGIPNQDDIVRFMIGRPVLYKPGERVQHSNFGYCVLGRIIEEVTGTTYEDYIREHILRPAGMWHTRMGPPKAHTYQNMDKDFDDARQGFIPLADDGVKSLFDSIPAGVLDSTLGWHSNVYDVARFFTALFKKGNQGLLRPETTEILLLPAEDVTKPEVMWDEDLYEGISFTVHESGSFWHASHNFDVGVTVYLRHNPPTTSMAQLFGQSSSPKANDLTMVFFGVSTMDMNRLDDLSQVVLKPFLLPQAPTNAYMADLAYSHVLVHDVDVAVKYHLSEHRLIDYASAMKLAGYFPTWIHGYQHYGESHFTTIFKKAKSTTELAYKVNILADKTKTVSYIAKEIQEGYQLSFLQSYPSSSRHGQLAHVTIVSMTRNPPTVMFDVDADLNTYFMAINEGLAEGFIPTIQSVDGVNDDIKVSFVLSQHEPMRRFKSYHDLSLEQLESTAKENAEENYSLAHLDTHTIEYQTTRFSAVFHQGVSHNWMLQVDITVEDLGEEMQKWQHRGYVPQILVAYHASHSLRFVAFWVAPPLP